MNPQEAKIDFRDMLQNEFVQRVKTNLNYSLREYAKELQTNHSTLSQILKGKRKITRAMVLKYSEGLKIDAKTVERILESLKTPEVTTKAFLNLTLDTHKVIAEWFHCAIFEMVTTEGFNSDPKIIAERLSITESQSRGAIERLIRVGLLEKNSKDELKQREGFVTTIGNNFTAESFRLLQEGILERSLRALKTIPFEQRDHSSMTMAINSDRIETVKKRIKKFRRSLCEELQAEPRRDSVYQLAISFFPLTTK